MGRSTSGIGGASYNNITSTNPTFINIYMYLCCVADSNQNWIFYEFLKLLKNLVSPCTIVHGLGPNYAKIEKERILHFYIFF